MLTQHLSRNSVTRDKGKVHAMYPTPPFTTKHYYNLKRQNEEIS